MAYAAAPRLGQGGALDLVGQCREGGSEPPPIMTIHFTREVLDVVEEFR